MRTSKPITVTLGKLQSSVDQRVESGEYASASEVVRAALRALDRQDEALDTILKARVQEALDDPRPDLSDDEVWNALQERHRARLQAG